VGVDDGLRVEHVHVGTGHDLRFCLRSQEHIDTQLNIQDV